MTGDRDLLRGLPAAMDECYRTADRPVLRRVDVEGATGVRTADGVFEIECVLADEVLAMTPDGARYVPFRDVLAVIA